MRSRQITPELREMAELQHAELFGRLHACEILEDGLEQIADPHVLYGWSMLTQEVLIRLGEASLKLLHILQFGTKPPRGHSLEDLWSALPEEVQDEVNAKRRELTNSGDGVSFVEYDNDVFQNVRYSLERLAGGQTIGFQTRQLYSDALAARAVAEERLGDIGTWPWAGAVNTALKGYRILPTRDGHFDVWIDEPIVPMDWAGAIIRPKDGRYGWTLYCGYTGRGGQRRGFEIPNLLYSWPINELFADSVAECAELVHRAYQEPCRPLQMAIGEALRDK